MKTPQYQIPQYQPVSGRIQPTTIREFKGLNTFDPFSIPDNQFTDMSNLTLDDYPALSVRPGYTQLGGAFGTSVLGLGVWKDQQLHAVFNDGVWRRWDGSSWITVLSGLSNSPASFTNFQGNQADICLFMTNGADGLKKWDGTSAVSFSDAPANLNFITTYQNRLWGSAGKELHSCALDQPDKWNLFAGNAEDSYVKDMESTRGEAINMLSGSLTKLTIGMPNSVSELYGGVPADFNTRLLTDDEGFQNNKSATTQDGLMYFMHRSGIFEYAGGTSPDRSFSEVVRRYLPGIYFDSAAGSDGRHSYFRVVYNSSDEVILVYDNRQGVASWVKWDGIPGAQFTTMQKQLYIGAVGGAVYRLDNTTDNGTPIYWQATTKPFTNASMAQKSRWIRLFVAVELAAGTVMDVMLSATADQDDFIIAQTVTGTGLRMQRVMVPLTNFQYDEILRVKIQGNGWARIHELTFQQRQTPLY